MASPSSAFSGCTTQPQYSLDVFFYLMGPRWQVESQPSQPHSRPRYIGGIRGLGAKAYDSVWEEAAKKLTGGDTLSDLSTVTTQTARITKK